MKNKTQKQHIIIIGAGVCGLAIGLELAKNNIHTTIYDKGEIGDGASNHSGGMLAAGIENEPSEASLWQLTRKSQEMWHDYAKEIETISGLNIDYRKEGTMMIATNQDDLKHVQFLYEYQQKLGVKLDFLSARDIQKQEPYLKTVGGMVCKDDHQVNSRLFIKALSTAFIKLGGRIHTHTPVSTIHTTNNTTTGIKLADGTIIEGDGVVVCAGVHSPLIKNIQTPLPVRPLKGQMLALQMDKNSPIINHVVWSPRSYLIPKSDGTLLIGATVEESGYNTENTAGGIYSLLESAWRCLPAVEDLPIKEMWASLRPTSQDDSPILGTLSPSNTYVATGHHRNGILLAPITAKIMADCILNNGKTAKEFASFSAERF